MRKAQPCPIESNRPMQCARTQKIRLSTPVTTSKPIKKIIPIIQSKIFMRTPIGKVMKSRGDRFESNLPRFYRRAKDEMLSFFVFH
jgi:hypothetical protein